MKNQDDDLDLNIPELQSGDMPGKEVNGESAIYAELGLDGQPDPVNPGTEEASDAILYTDNTVATDMTNLVSNTADYDGDLSTRLHDDPSDVNDAWMQAKADQLSGEKENDV